jgi:hypothetical protein
MTAVSFSMSRGVSGTRMSDITVGTSAPGSGDMEFRFQVLDTNSKNMFDMDLVLALKSFVRWVETNGNSAIAITNQPSGPPP